MAIGGNGCNYRQVATCPEGSMARMAWHGWRERGGKGRGVEKGVKRERRGCEKKYLRACTVGVEREKGEL